MLPESAPVGEEAPAVAEIGRQGADLAVKLAGRIVRRELSPQDHSALIAEALEKFPSQN